MPDTAAYLDDDIFARLRQDFLTDTRERLDDMESAAIGAKDGGALPAHTHGPVAFVDFEVKEARRVEVLSVAPGRAVHHDR